MLSFLGVDVGWVYPAVDSDGRTYSWSSEKDYRHATHTLADAGPVTIRRADGSTDTEDAYTPEAYAIIHGRQEYERRCVPLATSIVSSARRSHRGVALEDWDDRSMENFVALQRRIITESVRRRVPVVMVERAYTSQTCPECSHCEKANRAERNTFRCLKCGMEGQADHVAARNIAARALLPEFVTETIVRTPKVNDAERYGWLVGSRS